jgi:hypothetical protein
MDETLIHAEDYKLGEKYNFTIDLENTSYDPPKIEVRNL